MMAMRKMAADFHSITLSLQAVIKRQEQGVTLSYIGGTDRQSVGQTDRQTDRPTDRGGGSLCLCCMVGR